MALFRKPNQVVGQEPEPTETVVQSGDGFGPFASGGVSTADNQGGNEGIVVNNDQGYGPFGSSGVATQGGPGTATPVIVNDQDQDFSPFAGGDRVDVQTGGTDRNALAITSNQLRYDASGDLTSIVNGVSSNTVTIRTTGHPENLEELGDVTVTNIQDNQFLRYNSSNMMWENETVNLADLNDVTGTFSQNSILIRNNSSEWVPLQHTLENLSDVAGGAADGLALVYNGSTSMWTPTRLNIPDEVVTMVTTTRNNHINLTFSNGVLGVNSTITNYVSAASVSGNTLTLTVTDANDMTTDVAFTPTGTGGGSTIEVNGTEINTANFMDTMETMWSVSGSNVTLALSTAIARVSNIAIWAQTGNTDIIPTNKLPPFLMSMDVDNWALTANPNVQIPEGKIPSSIARLDQLATALQTGSNAERLDQIEYDAGNNRLLIHHEQGTIQIDLASDEIQAWAAMTNYSVGDIVYIVDHGIWVRENTNGASDPRTDTANWETLLPNHLLTINNITANPAGNFNITAGTNVTIDADASGITINASGSAPAPTEHFTFTLAGTGVTFSNGRYTVAQGTGNVTVTGTMGVTGTGFAYTGFNGATVSGPGGNIPTNPNRGTGNTFTFSLPISTPGSYSVSTTIESTGNGMALPDHVSRVVLQVVAPAERWYSLVDTTAPPTTTGMTDEGVLGSGDRTGTLTGTAANSRIFIALPTDFTNPRFRSGVAFIDHTTVPSFSTTGFTLYDLGLLRTGETIRVEVDNA